MKNENKNKKINRIKIFFNIILTALFVISFCFTNINKCYSQNFLYDVPSFKKINSDYTDILKYNFSNDTDKTKQQKIITLKSDTNKKVVKEKTIKNSITFQPFGLLFLLTNIEYDRYISKDFSAGLKIQFTTFWLRKAAENIIEKQGENEEDIEKAKIILNSFESWGLGAHFRYYTGGRSIEGFYLGFGADVSFFSFDELKEDEEPNYQIPPFPPPPPSSSTSVIEHRKGTLWRTMFEIGNKINLANGNHGVVIDWSFGAGAGYSIYDHDVKVVPLIGLGFGLGYAF